MSARPSKRGCLAVALLLFAVIAPWLVAEFRQARAAELASAAQQQGGAA